MRWRPRNSSIRPHASCADTGSGPARMTTRDIGASVPGRVRGLVEEGVAGVGVLLDVVLDPPLGQRRLERRGGAAQVAVPTAVARDDRAGAVERREVPRQHPVVDRRRLPPRPAREHEGEPAAHAEPDHPDRAVACRVGDQRRRGWRRGRRRPGRGRGAAPPSSGRGRRTPSPRASRSGASTTYPIAASRSACLRISSSRPKISCTSTSPGHGPSPSGTARYAGRSPTVVISPMAGP